MGFNFNKYDKQHDRNLTKYVKKMEGIYAAAAKEAAGMSSLVKGLSPDKMFSFDDYPATKKRIEKLLEELHSSITTAIVNGVRAEWALANNKNNELSNWVFGRKADELSDEAKKRYFGKNSAALEAFEKRTQNGLNLSNRVWKYTDMFKEEIEMGLDIGIRDGVSAAEMTRDLKKYLQHPDMLFRRVKDEHGNLVLSQRAKTYHPGRGVYRSSYMNARRLAATETNIAYRTADHLRWKDMDFVVGIEVKLSNNHNCKGIPVGQFADICDELAGKYPKEFKFTGWHPHCRCHAEPILKSEEEMDRDTERILNGEEPLEESENTVEDVPKSFNKWLGGNEERAKRSTSVPYFITDNEDFLPDGYKNLYAMKTPYETYAEYEAAMKYNKKHASFSPEITKNNRDLDKALPVMQGKIMNFTEADQLKCNPHYSDLDAAKEGYWENCQTCTVTYELRRRGFPVEAWPNKDDEIYKVWFPKNNLTWDDRFLNSDGSRPIKTRPSVLSDTVTAKVDFIKKSTEETGRYELYLKWKPIDGQESGAHVMIVERQKNGNLLWFDPQSGIHGSSRTFNGFMKNAVPVKISVLRIDDKIINPKFSERLKKASE